MKEQAFFFGSRKSLLGIVTEPGPAGMNGMNLPAVIIFNSGLIHRVGPNRLSVKIARMLARQGHTVLRFDFSGVGDSPVRGDNLPYMESNVVEAKEAMSLLEQARGASRFILMGICSGADTAFEVSLSDNRVVGIVPIDFYSVPSANYHFREYFRRFSRPRSWLKFITGKSDLWGTIRRASILSGNEASPGVITLEDMLGVAPPPARFISEFRNLAGRDVDICLIFSAGSAAFYNYRKCFKSSLEQIFSNGNFAVHYLPKSDHGFTLQYNQTLLTSRISDWTQRFRDGGKH